LNEQLFNLIEYTSRSVFLTGKAGTGKTTFLSQFVKKTNKNYIIAAPTGIAAINAGGITLHSLFYLPLTNFVPTVEYIDRNIAINIPQLIPHFKYRKEKLKLFRKLEVLIIDEVSMLRADVLDMIDMALRSARRSPLPFGGVQLLMIGDLYQLPPVVKSTSEQILYQHYKSPFFFDAKVLENISLLTVELKKVYRQSDRQFLQLLDAIRNNNFDSLDFDLLHSRYQPQFNAQESYIYLVSHNYMADQINGERLKAIPEKARKYEAKIEGEFKEHLYPNEPELILKVGAQVMFIRNDSSEEKKYYNGLLAKVVKLEEDGVTVTPDGQEKEISVEREVWENNKYYADGDNKIREEVVGKYEQFPFRLAWAVTIHKSQGLTFDKVIIDAGQSFASGQVYVALSRCRTLEGIVLKSKIHSSAILNDSRIADFQFQTRIDYEIDELIHTEKYNYALQKMLQTLDIRWLKNEMQQWLNKNAGSKSVVFKKEGKEISSADILQTIDELALVYEKFLNYVNAINQRERTEEQWLLIENKSAGAVQYFYDKVNQEIFSILIELYSRTKGVKGLKEFNKSLKSLLDSLEDYLSSLTSLTLLDKKLLQNKKERMNVKVGKAASHLITIEMFQKGKLPEEIAEVRGLAISTIYDHLAKTASTPDFDIKRLFKDEQIFQFQMIFEKEIYTSLTEYKQALPPSFEFNEIKILLKYYSSRAGKV